MLSVISETRFEVCSVNAKSISFKILLPLFRRRILAADIAELCLF